MQPAASSTFLERARSALRWREAAAFLRSHRASLAISLFVTLLGLGIFTAIHLTEAKSSFFIFLDTVEARSLDARFQFRGPVSPGPEVVIVAVDQKTYDKLGWPFPRFYYGKMLDALKKGGARVVGFDATFPKPDRNGATAATIADLERQYRSVHGPSVRPQFLADLAQLRNKADSDATFAKAIADVGNVVLGHLFFTEQHEIADMDPEQIKAYDEVLSFDAYPQVTKVKKSAAEVPNFPYRMSGNPAVAVEPNLKMFAAAARNYGAFNFEADNDGVFRREQLVFQYRDPESDDDQLAFYPSLDIQMARLYLGAGPQDTLLVFNPNGPDYVQLGSKKIDTDIDGKVLINFAGPTETYPNYSLIDVVDGKLPLETFRGKIVLVGTTATGIGDMRPIPFVKQSYPGVEIHANVLDNILHDSFLKRGSAEELTDLWVLLICGLVMGLLFVWAKPLHSTLLYLVALTVLVTFVYLQFAHRGRWLSLVLPGTTLSLNYLGVTSYRVLFEEKEKRKVRGAFSQYVAPGFIAQLLKDPSRLKLGGEEAELTVMFTDIRDFTAISEKLSPPALVELLNQYLTEMTQIVFENRGTLDKYIGDAVMAFWGRPFIGMQDHAVRACRAALQMKTKLAELNAAWRSQNRPELRIGIGINTGLMMVGNMGSERRFNYTVMGDHVNLSSRIENLNKEYGTQIILSEYTMAQVGGEFATRKLDLIRVKGKQKPVAIFELLDTADQKAKYAGLISLYESGLAAYQAGEWCRAIDFFRRVTEKYPEDRPAQLFLDRCEELMQAAPEGEWDGVYTMTHK